MVRYGTGQVRDSAWQADGTNKKHGTKGPSIICATPARAGESGPARQGCLHVQGRAGRQPAVSLYALSTRQPVVSMQQTHYNCSVLPRAETQGCKPYSAYKPNNFFSHTMYSSANFFSRCGTCLVCCVTSFLFPVFHIFSRPYQSILQVVPLLFKGALRLHFRRRVFDAKTKVGEREDPSNKNESPEAIESSRKTTFEFRRASADDVMRD